jgi:hypothetical protein
LSCTSADFELKTDVTKNYIDWAIEEGFQVIDVNIPKVVDFEDVGLVLTKNYCASLTYV